MNVGLRLMVKDEAPVIERCLLSVRDHVTSYVVQDTGSTDGTPDLVRKLLDPLPGEVYDRPFESFGANRTHLLNQPTDADHVLMLDADMDLVVDGRLRPRADACMVRVIEGAFVYRLPLLVSTRVKWRYEGKTHEYLTSDEPFSRENLDAWAVLHHCDGSSRPDKLERDRVLLEAEFSSRTLFYLAQTYAEQGYTQAAADLYGARAALGGWDEEAFYARYKQGALLRDTDLLWQAWNMRQSRAEPLWDLACIYRERGATRDLEGVVRLGKGLAVPGDSLFVHTDRYGEAWGVFDPDTTDVLDPRLD